MPAKEQTTMSFFKNFNDTVYHSLQNCIVTDNDQNEIEIGRGMDTWVARTDQLKRDNATMYFVGNGASSMMAGHMSADAAKNGRIRAQAFHETALMTAVSNDIAYENVFAYPLRRFADPGDVLITISSSGNSPNIVQAIEAAKELGVDVITLSGKSLENRSRPEGLINFYIPSQVYGIIECAHQVLLHSWLDQYMDANGLVI